MRGATYIGIYVLLSVLLAVSSHGQESKRLPTAESVTAHLTGGKQREWEQTLWIPILGPGGCVQGEMWTFGQDGKGVTTRLGGLLPTKEGKEDRGKRDGPVPSH